MNVFNRTRSNIVFRSYAGTTSVEFSDPVTPGFPNFQAPWRDTIVNNMTVTFQDRVQTLYSGMIITPIVALLVHVSIAKFFGKYKRASKLHMTGRLS